VVVVMVVVVPLVLVMGVARRSVPRAAAEVVRLGGFPATVAGHRGWFGSYDMAGLGTAWCVDHGIAAPDADLGYVPTGLAEVSPPARTAMAWAVGRYGFQPDRVTAAALTLVLHDLMGAAYPSGRLDVGRLTTGQLSGFEGNEEAVLVRARAVKADALAHAHLRGPLTLSTTVDTAQGPVRPGRPGVLVARLTDAAGAGVAGVELATSATRAVLTPGGAKVTDGNGKQRFGFVAASGQNGFNVTGVVPDLQLQAFAPSAKRAQRVARPGRVPVSAGARVKAEIRRLKIRKTGDAAAYLPLAGARFQVRPMNGSAPAAPVGELVTAPGGTSSSIELDPGTYQVTEAAAPAGYTSAGPWTVDLTTTDVVLEAPNAAVPGTGRITKVDAATGQPLAGATLSLAYDADRDGGFETPVAQWVSGVEPAVRTLRPGDYEVRELAAPDGFRPTDLPVRFSVAPGKVSPLTVANAPLPVPPPAPSPPTASPAPPSTSVLTEARSAAPLRRVSREQPLVRRLPETGHSLSLLAGAGSALVVAGLSLVAAGNRSASRVRRRVRSLLRPVMSPS
jgi:hypothetical protein